MSDDYFYYRAKYTGYRSRASFKLIEIDRKFSIFHRGNVVLDLGASPGGWSQVAAQRVGRNGRVIAVDKAFIPPFKKERNITIVQRDILSSSLIPVLKKEYETFDVVLSDCAPNVSGNWVRDHNIQIMLANRAIDIIQEVGKTEGRAVIKVFQGEEFEEFLSRMKQTFNTVKLFKPRASRKKSAEIYAIGLNKIEY